MSKLIPLTQGKFAIVDDENYEWLSQFKWCAVKTRSMYYAARTILVGNKKQNLYMHRQILHLKKGDKRQADHKNHNGLNNLLSNLRICSHAQNQYNRYGKTTPKTSIYKGVWYSNSKHDRNLKKWVTHIAINGKEYHIGRFHTEFEAAFAYDRKAIELFGEFAHTNF